MTEERTGVLVERLVRKLGLEAPDDDTLNLLEDEIWDAEAEILLFLGVPELEQRMESKVVELAAVYYHTDQLELKEVESLSYTEGQMSQSERYRTPEDCRREMKNVLNSLARYRRVSC